MNQAETCGGRQAAYDGAVDAFTKRLEDDAAAIKADLAVVRSNYVTKVDLRELADNLIKWMIATTVSVVAAMISIAVGSVANISAVSLDNPSLKAAAPPAPSLITVPYPVPANGLLPGAQPHRSQKVRAPADSLELVLACDMCVFAGSVVRSRPFPVVS